MPEIREVAPALVEESIINTLTRQFGKKLYVCSFHFMPRHERREYMTRQFRNTDGSLSGTFRTDYNLEAVKQPKDRPSVCVVMDGLQRVFMGTNEIPPFNKRYENAQITASEIAVDIVRAMSGGEPAGPEVSSYPAIWISSIDEQAGGKFPRVAVSRTGVTEYSKDWDTWGTPRFAERFPEFAAECEAYAGRQWHHAEYLCGLAMMYHVGPQKNPANINERHHLAAKWIGASPAQQPWMEQATTSFGANIDCPICGKPTSGSHPKCQNCGEIINRPLYESLMKEINKPAHA